jgi:hypothetical protein
VYALLGLGFTDEAARFAGGWATGFASTATVRTVRWTSCTGWTGPPTSPRRSGALVGLPRLASGAVGNGAAGQLQLDIYGEALDSIYVADRAGW